MTDRILKGAKISDTPVELVANPAKIINQAAASLLGIEIPADLLSEFTVIG